MQLYLEGLLFGVIPVFFIGPVFFTLVHASLRDGFGAGALVAAGIAVSDVIAIALCALGVGQLLSQSWGEWALQFAGGLILVGFGVAMVVGAAKPRDPGAPAASGLRLFVSGFVVNFVNPFVFTFWIGAIGGFTAQHGFGAGKLTQFFGGVVTTILVTDVLKARLAELLGQHLHGGAIAWAQRVSGLALGGFGLYLLWRAAVSLPEALTGHGA